MNAHSPVLRHVHFVLKELPESFHDFRILHLSDIHFDQGFDTVAAVSAILEDIDTDLCVMTGDYQRGHVPDMEYTRRQMQRLISHIDAPHGTYGCLGNCDAYAFVEPFRELGLRILMNESVEIRREAESMWLLGVDDPHYFRCDSLALAAENVPTDAFKVLLAHSPRPCQRSEQAEYRPLPLRAHAWRPDLSSI